MCSSTKNFDKNLIVPISINDGNNIFKSKRATSTLMDNRLLKSILGIQKIEFCIDQGGQNV